ncbi:MAG: HPr family phosphocarrier protein [Exilibacterium sp.]
MINRQITIINKLGLHARAAAKLATEAGRYNSRIQAGLNGKLVDGKSVMSLMLLAANQGSTLDLIIEGEDEEQALKAIENLIGNRFGEDE